MMKAIILIATAICLLNTACLGKGNTTYTKEYVLQTAGLGGYYRESDLNEVPCIYISQRTSTVDKHFDYMNFYIFDSASDSKTAYRETAKWFSDIEEEGTDYRKGWLGGVCDAEVEEYVYITGNMIIIVEMQVVSCWADDYIYADEPYVEPDLTYYEWSPEFRQEIIDLMRQTF